MSRKRSNVRDLVAGHRKQSDYAACESAAIRACFSRQREHAAFVSKKTPKQVTCLDDIAIAAGGHASDRNCGAHGTLQWQSEEENAHGRTCAVTLRRREVSPEAGLYDSLAPNRQNLHNFTRSK